MTGARGTISRGTTRRNSLMPVLLWVLAAGVPNVAMSQERGHEPPPNVLLRGTPSSVEESRLAYEYGTYFFGTGNLERSLQSFDAAIRLDPNFALAYAARASVRSQRGDHQAGLDDANRAISLDPNLPLAHFNRGVIYGRMHDWAAAARDYAETLRLNPDFGGGRVHNNLGSALMAQGKYAEAIETFSAAIQRNPRSAASFFNRSLAHERAGHIQSALSDLDSTIALAPGFGEGHHRRAWLLLQQNQDRPALADLDAVVEIDPQDAVAVADRALLHEKLGHKIEALRDFARFAQLSKEDPRTVDRTTHLPSSTSALEVRALSQAPAR